jgi:hypothetical protein
MFEILIYAIVEKGILLLSYVNMASQAETCAEETLNHFRIEFGHIVLGREQVNTEKGNYYSTAQSHIALIRFEAFVLMEFFII